MFKDIKIQNFRCFENTEIQGFERINLIGGKNNAGKSALLETLLILALPRPQSLIALFLFKL
jgi:AAA15 family ATPase/GTPase